MFSRILEEISLQAKEPDVALLAEFIEKIRASESRDPDSVKSIDNLIEFFTRSPQYARDLHEFIVRTVSSTKQIDLFADSGITHEQYFFSSLFKRIGEHILPKHIDPRNLGDLLESIFDSSADVEWLRAITGEEWYQLCSLLIPEDSSSKAFSREYRRIRTNVTTAMSIVSYRITGISLEAELVKAYPDTSKYHSPFIALNREILDFIDADQALQERRSDSQDPIQTPDESHIYVMIDQCKQLIGQIKNKTRKTGISISLTNKLLRLGQNIDRLSLLLNLLNHDTRTKFMALGKLLFIVTDHQHNQSSIRALIRNNTELLSLRVTENASKVGEKYVSTDKKGYWEMYRKAAGAGFIIAFLASFKIILSKFVLAPLGRAFVNSMNYGLGFVYIHILHWKIATKQPAMTAASLASSIDNDEINKKVKLNKLSQMTVDIMRTQFIAIIGNISVAMPTAFLICMLWEAFYGSSMLSADKAGELLHDLDPLRSLSLFHAAIAGVCLFLSGLISGYYDNKAVYRNVGPRLRQHPGLKKLFGLQRLDKISTYLENNLGALAGNFWFGVMLGSMGTLGYILGLPLDIRHIAFSSANFIQGIFYLEQAPSLFFIIYTFIGVLLIGLVNLLVSFSLALIVALRSRRITYFYWKSLFELLLFHFLTKPLEFFWPTKKQDPSIEKQ